MQVLYAATLGVKVQQERVNLIANNIANINTPGYKSQRMTFKETLYTKMLDRTDVEGYAQPMGLGSMVTIRRDFSESAPLQSGNALDLYLNGDGYFTVRDGSTGQNMHTRNGSFAISTEQDGSYLVTSQGHYVIDDNNNRIRLEQGASNFEVNAQGLISVNGNALTTLRIVDFPNKDGLAMHQQGCYIETEISGAPVEADAQVYQGATETSNVDLALEFSHLIRAQRSYSLVSRAISIWDQMAAATNNLR